MAVIGIKSATVTDGTTHVNDSAYRRRNVLFNY